MGRASGRKRQSRRKKDQPCAYCAGPGGTIDHVPAKTNFAEPLPSDLITVPACDRCNRGDGITNDEEYFANVILSHHRAEGAYARTLSAQRFSIENKTDRRVRTAIRLLDDVSVVDLITPGGVYLGKAPRLSYNSDRLERVVTKIMRGLFFEEFGRPVPDDRRTFSIFDPDDSVFEQRATQSLLAHGQGRKVGSGAFEYRVLEVPERPGAGMGALLFWGDVMVIVIMMPADVLDLARKRVGAPEQDQGTLPATAL